MSKVKRIQIAVVTICFVCTAIIILMRAIPGYAEDPRAVAEQVREAYLKQDAKALFARLSQAEKDANGLSEGEFVQLCDELIFPKTKGWKVTRGESLILGRGEEGVARFEVELPNQPPLTQTFAVWMGPEGAATDSLADLLFPIYYIEGLRGEMAVRDARSGLKFRLAGLKRDRAALKKYGVNTFSRFSTHEGEHQTRDIDTLIMDWEKRLMNADLSAD